MKILVLEDDEAIGKGLEYSLAQEGYFVTLCNSVQKALVNIKTENQDVYLLDLTLPDGSGYDVCQAVKEKCDAPVIFLTAYDDEVNVVMGLDLGADDYVSKPFRLRELMARIKAVLRRHQIDGNQNIIKIGNVSVNINEGKVYKNDNLVFMTALEYRLFLTLLNNRGKLISRNQLLESIWDIDGDFVNDNTLSVYIKRIREKLEDDTNNPKIVQTVRGMGYKVE